MNLYFDNKDLVKMCLTSYLMRNKLRFRQGDETDINRHAEFSVHFLYVTVNSVTMNTELKFI